MEPSVEKAPDAFRTISEVADDLDIPQHVLRFWETRFSQIKPMKRSGGRRYYRPDDVDLLKGIRHLLYGEGYTIRGVQRILKEQGLRSVQRLSSGGPLPEAMRPKLAKGLDDAAADDGPVSDPVTAAGYEVMAASPSRTEPAFQVAPVIPPRDTLAAPAAPPVRPQMLTDFARSQLAGALEDMLACRRMLDAAMKPA